MSCKHCSGPIFFTKIVSTLGDFRDWRDAFRLRIRSAEMISQATHLTVIGWITGKMSFSIDIAAASRQYTVVGVQSSFTDIV